MKIVVLHNFYQQKGGEDEIFATEADMLEAHGHTVVRYTVHNDAVHGMNKLQAGAATIWNWKLIERFATCSSAKNPTSHISTTHFPLISPAGYHAARDEGVPVVKTLHNYRLLCPKAIFFRDGRVCEDCLHKPVPWPGVIHKCYRDSTSASAAVASMLTVHNALDTWRSVIDMFIAYSQFARAKFIEAGYPEEELAFKTNCLHPSPALGGGRRNYGLFVGRLVPEKGILTTIAAWSRLNGSVPLKIVGDGPLAQEVARLAGQTPGVEFLGRRPLSEVYELMGDAQFLVMPSEWYETFGRVVIEAYAKGTPVIASKIGAVGELIDHQRTGLHFAPGDPEDLARQVRWVTDHAEEMRQMRYAVRAEFEAKYTAEPNYQTLIGIYEGVRSKRTTA